MTGPGRLIRSAAAVAIVAVVIGGAIAWNASSKAPVALPDIDTLTCPAHSIPVGAPSSISGLARLAVTESMPLSGSTADAGHNHAGKEPPLVVANRDRTTFEAQVRAAARAACSLETVADAQRAGYVRSSFYTQGVGIHWTNWRLVDAPFDPARPSMLLYGTSGGRLHLVGFSYWVRSARPPSGFVGASDHWHRHFGLCFESQGQLETEGLRDPGRCAHIWLNGSDLWMLHAWVVPGNSNAWGLFAPLNPALCQRNVNDAIRCSQVGG